MAVLGWAYAFYALNLPINAVLGSKREMRVFLPLSAATFLLNIGLNYCLIPRYSYVGAAFGTCVVFCAAFVARFYLLRRIVQVHVSEIKGYLRLLCVLAATLATLLLARPHLPWPVLGALAAVTYPTFLYLLRGLTQKEKRVLTRRVRSILARRRR
jgi:O-antigen/teichoic acid export membrane protein